MTPEVRKTALRFALGAGLAALLLWFFFRRTSWDDVHQALAGASLPMLLFVVAANVTSQLTRAWRWRIMLRPLDPAIGLGPPWRYFNIGLAVSSLLPGRLGEVLRPYLLARDRRLGFGATFATVVVERIVDLFVVLALLASGFVIPGALGPNAGAPEMSAIVATIRAVALGALVVVSLGVMTIALLLWRPRSVFGALRWATGPLPDRLAKRLLDLLESFTAGLDAIRGPRQALAVAGTTLLTWAVLVASYHTALRAFDIVVPVHHMLFFLAVVALGVVVPTPGGTGAYHAAIIGVAGTLWGYSEDRGGAVAACAIVTHLAAILPIVVVGVAGLLREGIGVRALSAPPTAAADSENDDRLSEGLEHHER